MNHFIYEIDERKLKILFQDMEDSLTDSAWEEFQKSHKQETKHTTLVMPELNLNRAVVLGIGFLLLVIGLSFGIYKIIQINPGGASKNSAIVTLKADTIAPSTPSSSTAPASSPKPLASSTLASIDTTKQQPVVAQPKQEAMAKDSSASIAIVPSKKIDSQEKTSVPLTEEKKSTKKDTTINKKKKGKKKTEQPNIETEVLQDIRPLPPPPSEEQEIKLE